MTGRVRVVSTDRPYEGRRVNLRRDRLRDESGREYVREVVEHPGAAVVVPLLPDGRLVLVRQYRHVFGAWLIELPAGTLEPGEEPAACAARELEEETGYRAGKLRPLGIVYPSPGVLSEEMHFFEARELAAGTVRRDPGEEMEVRLATLAELLAEVRTGAVRDGKTIIGLWLALGEGA